MPRCLYDAGSPMSGWFLVVLLPLNGVAHGGGLTQLGPFESRAACLNAQTQLTDRPGTGQRSFLDRSGDGAITICLSQAESP